MASIAMMIGGAVVNAVAFSGSSFLFSSLSGGASERKRHDLAIEKLNAAHASWAQDRQERIDFINRKLMNEKHAESRFNELSDAMRKYHEIYGEKLSDLRPEPKLSDFYTPSEEQHNGELTFITISMVGLGALLYYKY